MSDEPICQFLHMLASERSATRSTLSAYEADLRDFYAFLKNASFESVTVQTLQDYLTTQSHLSASTLVRRLSCLRQFYAFLGERGMVKENPVTSIKLPPCKAKPLPVLKPEQVRHFWEEVQARTDPNGKRFSLFLHLLCMTNIPINELIALPVSWADHAELPDIVRESLRNYIAIRSSFLTKGKESPWLFPSRSQRGYVTRQRFGQLLKEFALRSGLGSDPITFASVRQGCQLTPNHSR